MLQSKASQRVGHNWTTEEQQQQQQAMPPSLCLTKYEILEYLTNSGFNQWTHLNLSHNKFGVREFQHQNSSFRVSSKTQKAFCVYLSSFSKMSIL